MDISIIATPIIGAGIGYVTNYIAVKMLFRPLKPVKIGNFQVPFTPGIIPKEKNRLAKGIGDIVGQRLVTKDGIEKMLLSEEVEKSLKTKISDVLNHSNKTLESFLIDNLSEEKTDSIETQITVRVTSHIRQTLLESNVGQLLSEEIIKSIKEYFQGGFLAMMLNDSILGSIGEQIGKGITNYIETNGFDLLLPYIKQEYGQVMKLSITDVDEFSKEHEIPVENIIYNLYQSAVQNNLDTMLSYINVTQIVEEQIKQMDVLELEDLILTVMKKELNAIVNLGALIGLVLGLINLLI